LKGLRYAPLVMITEKLANYGAAPPPEAYLKPADFEAGQT
jgi:hypothetical protein